MEVEKRRVKENLREWDRDHFGTSNNLALLRQEDTTSIRTISTAGSLYMDIEEGPLCSSSC